MTKVYKAKKYNAEQIAFYKDYNKGRNESKVIPSPDMIRQIINLSKEWNSDMGDYGYTEPEDYVYHKLKQQYGNK